MRSEYGRHFRAVWQGNCAEETAAKYGITREIQDAHAIESYKRAAAASKVSREPTHPSPLARAPTHRPRASPPTPRPS